MQWHHYWLINGLLLFTVFATIFYIVTCAYAEYLIHEADVTESLVVLRWEEGKNLAKMQAVREDSKRKVELGPYWLAVMTTVEHSSFMRTIAGESVVTRMMFWTWLFFLTFLVVWYKMRVGIARVGGDAEVERSLRMAAFKDQQKQKQRKLQSGNTESSLLLDAPADQELTALHSKRRKESTGGSVLKTLDYRKQGSVPCKGFDS